MDDKKKTSTSRKQRQRCRGVKITAITLLGLRVSTNPKDGVVVFEWMTRKKHRQAGSSGSGVVI
jgi:hypothetical protein